MSNRLATATSPYLLQHADNPVDWWEWGDEPFAEARKRDVPVFLSVGYAACHWCHVMAHESFEDEATAAYLNEHFVAVKVDREERPDVDSVYMEATQAMTGQGGWPMTCLLTADGAPFFCGTYFPDRPRMGMPSFRQVLEGLVAAWRNRRDEIIKVGGEVVAHLRRDHSLADEGAPDAADLDAAVAALARESDRTHAGFGGAPKFPPSMVLELLLRHAARTGPAGAGALQMVDATCEAMARGGMYDQLGGGFARYAVDRAWVVPHFEKMLYDNALLLRAYLHWWRQTGAPLGARIAAETADFLVRELRTADGGFASALDADSESGGRSVEGAFYSWTPAQLVDVLGRADGEWAAQVFEVTEAGTFEHGASTLQLHSDPEDASRLDEVRRRLTEAREERARPARDDKVVAAWNGLAVGALAEAGALLERTDLVTAAVDAAELLWRVHADSVGRLARVSRDGAVGAHAGVLEDYACVAQAYLTLLGVTGDPVWLDRAGSLLEHLLNRFADGRGGFYDTADDAEALIRRPQDPTDNATPSGQSAAAGALLHYAAVTGSGHHREAAVASLAASRTLGARVPRFAGEGLAVAEAVISGPLEVAVVGTPNDPGRSTLHRVALRSPVAGTAVVVGEPGGAVPLLRDRPLLDGAAAAYVCRGSSANAPRRTPRSCGDCWVDRSAQGVRRQRDADVVHRERDHGQ
ncbi:MAG: thioredoxin domain-containing protein [Nocardioidaceae bacterium]